LPTRKQLAGFLLDLKYEETSQELQIALKDKIVCMTTDGFTNVNHEAVINYLVSAQGKSYYLESINTGKISHSGEWMAADIERVIKKQTDLQIVGLVTDNTKANKCAWNILSRNFRTSIFTVDFVL
jgi:hypothetical protein